MKISKEILEEKGIIEKANCPSCRKPFYRYLKAKHNMASGIRSKNCITCSKACSIKLLTMREHGQKIRRLIKNMMTKKMIKEYRQVLHKLRTDKAVSKQYYYGCRDMFNMILDGEK
jgi:hypothetical protein